MSQNTPDNFMPDEVSSSINENIASQSEEVPDKEQTEATAPPEQALPPEAQGEVDGGPLGCCLGTMVGLLLSLSLAVISRLYADPLGQLFQHNYGLLGLIVRILMGVLAVALAIFCGSVGWRLGRRFYREYEPPVTRRRKRDLNTKKRLQKV